MNAFRSNLLSLTSLVLLACGHVFAQSEVSNWAQVEHIAVSRSAVSSPALKYELLPRVADQTPGNAAPVYLQAFATSTEIDFDKVEYFLSGSMSQSLLEEASSYLEKYAEELRLLDIAARRSHCDWDIPLREQGLDVRLNYVRSGRLLGRLLCVRVRMEIYERRFEKAIYSLQTGFALASRYSNGNVFLALMASTDGDGIEIPLYDRIREWIAVPNSPNLYWALANLPRPFHNKKHALQTEDAALYLTFPEFRHPETLSGQEATELLVRVWSTIYGSSDEVSIRQKVSEYVSSNSAAAQKHARSIGERQTQLPEATLVACHLRAQYEQMADELYKWAGVPYWQAHRGFKEDYELFQKADSHNPLRRLVPRVHSQFLAIEICEREACLLQCIEAMRALAANPDMSKADESLLTSNTKLPLPLDPITGEHFQLRFDWETATISAKSTMPGFPRSSREYRITFTE